MTKSQYISKLRAIVKEVEKDIAREDEKQDYGDHYEYLNDLYADVDNLIDDIKEQWM